MYKFISRKRLWLKTSCCLLLQFSLALPVVAHELGLQLYSVRNQMENDLPNTFSQINKWGLNLVEGGGKLYGLSVDEYRNELIKHNLEVASVDTSYDEIRDNPIAAVYKARFFGSRFATFYWIPHDGKKGFTIEEAKAAVAVMNKAGKLLKQNGITLQYHAHGYEFLPYKNATILDYMLQNVTDAAFQMDVFWMKQGGMDPTALLKKYPGKFLSLHLKDRKKGSKNSLDGKADVEANVVLGSGDVGIASVVAEAKKQGIRYFFLEDESSRVMRQIPQSIEYLKQLEKY
ncbi:sugar phosphate isomerase/epimerase [Paraglaciecola aquimarina]|uniref:Sugar phosphate isomerase/epimerase n=1 Tax=Paraglaciecola aquimarina TaxID=1235557 RepID=A0ABU3STU8_9ALTE|nr:sugar phosphate isomerase/epimerase [Paraglaciecola aquimarina]MDU0353436.1 sugar phosphate isomerase/epimerase [Paraglaciecola aquimarina]